MNLTCIFTATRHQYYSKMPILSRNFIWLLHILRHIFFRVAVLKISLGSKYRGQLNRTPRSHLRNHVIYLFFKSFNVFSQIYICTKWDRNLPPLIFPFEGGTENNSGAIHGGMAFHTVNLFFFFFQFHF